MPTFHFVKEVLQPYLRTAGREKAARTQETERWIEKKLQFFSGYFLSEEGRSANELTGSVVIAYREARKLRASALCRLSASWRWRARL